MPTYQNASTLPRVLDRVAALGHPMIVVDDGCTDGTAELLEERRTATAEPPLTVVTHRENQGKGAALQTAFAEARRQGFTHVVTMDTDDQLDPEDIPRLLEAAAAQPDALVVGARDDERPDYPARSRVGRRLSNAAIKVECGARVEDSQCGLRVYPLPLLETVDCRAGHFGFEAEVITRAAWAGAPLVNVPVSCTYFEGEERVTHFRAWGDSLRGIALHARLLALSPFKRLAGRRRHR